MTKINKDDNKDPKGIYVANDKILPRLKPTDSNDGRALIKNNNNKQAWLDNKIIEITDKKIESIYNYFEDSKYLTQTDAQKAQKSLGHLKQLKEAIKKNLKLNPNDQELLDLKDKIITEAKSNIQYRLFDGEYSINIKKSDEESTISSISLDPYFWGSDSELSTGSDSKLSTGSDSKLSTGSDSKLSTGSDSELSTGSDSKLSTGSDSKLSTGSNSKLSTGSNSELSTGSDSELSRNSDTTAQIPIKKSNLKPSKYTKTIPINHALNAKTDVSERFDNTVTDQTKSRLHDADVKTEQAHESDPKDYIYYDKNTLGENIKDHISKTIQDYNKDRKNFSDTLLEQYLAEINQDNANKQNKKQNLFQKIFKLSKK